MLLPHGYEGQGPDHSSARIDASATVRGGHHDGRAPSTPANYFHLLRRQHCDAIHRPLIVFTPKSMLRNKAAAQRRRTDFTERQVPLGARRTDRRVDTGDRDKVTRVLLMRGKLYYELVAAQARTSATTSRSCGSSSSPPCRRAAGRALDALHERPEFVWVQEEPANQGAWPSFGLTLPEAARVLPGYQVVARRPMRAPSAGSSKVHAVEQQEILDEAFGP